MKKELDIDRLVERQKEIAELYERTPLISVNSDGVHISGVANLRKLAQAGCEFVIESRGDDNEYPLETHFVYDGVIFYAIQKEAE